MAAKKKNKLKPKLSNKERTETLTTLWAVIEKLDTRTTSATVEAVPTGALKCALGALYCALNLVEGYMPKK
jgi:hypothetical protein